MSCSAHQYAKIQKGISTSRNVPALGAILNVLQQSYFLCYVNQICFQQIFVTAWVENWAKVV